MYPVGYQQFKIASRLLGTLRIYDGAGDGDGDGDGDGEDDA